MDSDTVRRSHLDLDRQVLDRFLGTAQTFAEAWDGCTEPGPLLFVLIEALRLGIALRSPLMGPVDVLWIFDALLGELVQPLLVSGGPETVAIGERVSHAYLHFLRADASDLPSYAEDIARLFARTSSVPADPRHDLVRRFSLGLDRVRCLLAKTGCSQQIKRLETNALLEALRDAASALDGLCHQGDGALSSMALRACHVIRWAPEGALSVGRVVERVLACGPHVRRSYQVTLAWPEDGSSSGRQIDIFERASGAFLGSYQVGARSPSLHIARDYSVALLAIRSNRNTHKGLPPTITIWADVPITARFSGGLERPMTRAA